jgi:hypothetical protein
VAPSICRRRRVLHHSFIHQPDLMTTTTADASTSFSQNIESNLTFAIYFLGKKYDLQKFFFNFV